MDNHVQPPHQIRIITPPNAVVTAVVCSNPELAAKKSSYRVTKKYRNPAAPCGIATAHKATFAAVVLCVACSSVELEQERIL